MTFEAHKTTIYRLVGSSATTQIRIPDYQRGYSWDSAQVECFIEDICTFAENRSSPPEYFMGPIILMRGSSTSDEVFIVDGQQRIATAMIVLATIRDLSKDLPLDDGQGRKLADRIHKRFLESEGPGGGTRPSIRMGHSDESFFEAYVRRDSRTGRIPPNSSSGLIKKASHLIQNRLQDRIRHRADRLDYLANLVDVLTKKVAMVAIDIENDRQALDVFENLNAKGRPLSDVDLVRHRLMQSSLVADRTEVRNIWTRIENLLSAQGGSFRDFLTHCIISFTGERLVGRLHLAVAEHLDTSRVIPLDFISELETSCQHYSELIKQLPTGVHHQGRKHLRACHATLGIKSTLPLFLAASRFRKRPEFTKIVLAVEALVVRHSVFAGGSRSDLDKVLFAAARVIREATSIELAVAQVLDHLRLASPSAQEMEAGVARKDMRLKKNAALYVLRELETQRSGSEGATEATASLEHIFPVKWQEHWGSRKHLLPYLWHIGNLSLLTPPENAKAGNRNYGRKKKVYESSKMALSRDIPTANQWGVPPIVRRAKDLARLAEKRWKL